MVLRRRANPDTLLIVALAAAAVLLIALGWQLTFFQDTWTVLLERQPWNAHSLLYPHNEHLIVFQAIVEKGLVEIFGMRNAHPEMLFMTATLLASAALVYVYVKRRLGGWVALLIAVLLLFFGEAWEILLWPFEMEFSAPFAAGMGMLLVLEREDRRGDIWGTVLLVLAVGFGSLGVSFIFAAFAQIVVASRERGWKRLWIVAIPVVLYLAWYAKYGHEAEHHVTLDNILNSPAYVFEGVGAGFASVLGLANAPLTGVAPISPWAPALAIGAIGLAVWGQVRRPGLPRTFWPIAAAAVSFWLLASFNFIPGREASSVRYVYADGAFVLLIAVELFAGQGIRLGKKAIWVGAVILVLALGPNIAKLYDGFEFLKEQTQFTRSDTGAMDIASDTVSPEFFLTPELSGTATFFISGQRYQEAVAKWGSPGYSPDEIAAAPETGRKQADIVLASALPLATETEAGGFDPSLAGAAECAAVPPGGPAVALKPGKTRIQVGPGAPASLALRRFAATEYAVPLSAVEGGSAMTLDIPKDKAPEYPWYLRVTASQEVFVCSG
ncbi:MAG: hypothetical protein JWO14_3861 [Solirubrobacterales bacterium]|nr:hypothetical protein [Solirubrobacterales bacterium]